MAFLQSSQCFLFLICCTYLSSCNEYHCWPPSQRHVVTFKNNPNKTIDHFPTVRLIQGYYPSQFAMQYAAYVYLKEQMGLDVIFFPNNDPDALFNRYKNYNRDWCGISNKSTCSPLAPYPQFYFEDIKNNEYDLLFEIWDIMVRDGNGFEYFKEHTVINAGMSGVYGEGGWFIPKYVYDSSPEMYIPQQLKSNQTLRQIFIDAYTINSDTDYIEKWWNAWNDTLEHYPKEYGTPSYSKPIIFGSYEGYAISRYSNDLVHNLFGSGINWTFVAFGIESNLTEFVIDLYSKGLPFIANLYSPHLDFATKINNSYMLFERIALPRNPNNNVDDVCYSNGQCAFPLTPLIKIGNPKLLSQFAEMKEFLFDFRMNTNDINDIIAYYTQVSNYYYHLSKHEMWINATCKWLKNNKAITDEWYQDIVRYDCIFESINQGGCGFDYYYNTFEDAINKKNQITIAPYNSIAGYCMNSTDKPECNCYSDLFVGVTCRDSCHGVIGPVKYYDNYDDSTNLNNESVVQINNFTFLICSGHGTCDMHHKTCKCDAGFGSNGCEIVFKVFSYSTEFILLWGVSFLICIIVLSVSIWWIYNFKKYATIKAIAPNLTILFTFGLISLSVGTIIYLFHPLNNILCIARIHFYGIGSILTIMAPLCKTYRVSVIFTQAQCLEKVNIPDKKLLIYLINALIIEVIICIICSVLHEINGGVEKRYLSEYNRIEYICNNSVSVQYVELINYLYIVTFIVLLCFFSFKNRRNDKNKKFTESQCAYFGSFFTLFVFIVVVLFNIVATDINVIITIQSGAMLITICVIWILFYGQRMYQFYMYPNQRHIVLTEITVNNEKKIDQQTTNKIQINSVYVPKYARKKNKITQANEECKNKTDTELNEMPKVDGTNKSNKNKSYEHLEESDSSIL